MEPPRQSDIRQYLSRDEGGVNAVPTVIPSHSSQDDDTCEVNTEVRGFDRHDIEPDILPTHPSQTDNRDDVKAEVRNDYKLKNDKLVEIDYVEPTCSPTHSSQDDDKPEVKTGVRSSGSGETRDDQFVRNVNMHVKTDDECEFINRRTWCTKHNCQVNKMTITSKKWQWIQSKKCYGIYIFNPYSEQNQTFCSISLKV